MYFKVSSQSSPRPTSITPQNPLGDSFSLTDNTTVETLAKKEDKIISSEDFPDGDHTQFLEDFSFR